LSERVHENQGFKTELLSIILLSKTNPELGRAAANAITILVRAGVHEIGASLRGIRIPGADLTGGQLDSAKLQGEDLNALI